MNRSIEEKKEPQIKAPRVAPLEGASTYAPAEAYVSMHCGGHDADERRFVESDIQSIFVTEIDSNLINSPQRTQSSQRSFPRFTDNIDLRVSASSAFHYSGLPYSLSPYLHVNCVSAFICVHLRLNTATGGL